MSDTKHTNHVLMEARLGDVEAEVVLTTRGHYRRPAVSFRRVERDGKRTIPRYWKMEELLAQKELIERITQTAVELQSVVSTEDEE